MANPPQHHALPSLISRFPPFSASYMMRRELVVSVTIADKASMLFVYTSIQQPMMCGPNRKRMGSDIALLWS